MTSIPGWRFDKDKDPSFAFTEEPHGYVLAKRRLWSPSSLFRKVGYVDPTYFTDEHRYRGHYVHWIIRLHNEGDLDRADVAPEMIGFLDAWCEFCELWKVKPRLSELPIYHPQLLYGVTPDCEAEILGGDPAIIEAKSGEAKSGPPPWWTALQTAFQDMAIGAWDKKETYRRRIGVKLFRNGKFKPVEYDDEEDYHDARANLRTVLRRWPEPPIALPNPLDNMAAL
jgi:hypothetical protein